jgi:tetratricopeptide (TPR) repeat protein
MKLHPEVEAAVELERARESLAARQTLAALAHLEKALKLQDNPSWYSYLGYCIAKQRGQIKKGIDLCLSSLELEREELVHYLNLGNIHLVSGNKSEALRVFRKGIVSGDHEEIQRILDEIGMRKSLIIRSLPRNNPVNRFLGILLGKIGLR